MKKKNTKLKNTPTGRSMEINVGPFTSPFPHSLHNSLEMFHYAERAEHYGALPHIKNHSGNKVHLQVGDKLAYDDMNSNRMCFITHFLRGCIHCTENVTIPTDFII